MGEAKHRGTKEERISTVTMQNEEAARMIVGGQAPHYAFIFDRSPKGHGAFQQMKEGPPEIQARANSAAVQLWETTPEFEFVVIWGTWGYSGGLTLPCLDLAALLGHAIPAAVERTTEKGGLCAFMPIVDETVRSAVIARIAELQPSPGQPQ